jgi:hypothetical protein
VRGKEHPTCAVVTDSAQLVEGAEHSNYKAKTLGRSQEGIASGIHAPAVKAPIARVRGEDGRLFDTPLGTMPGGFSGYAHGVPSRLLLKVLPEPTGH